MRVTCDIIKDLLPLYEDEVCSEDSKKAVEEHLRTCLSCAAYYKKIKAPIQEEVQEEAEIEKNETEAKAIKQSFKKVKYYWIKWILVSCIVISLVGLFALGCVSRGITASNWQAIKKAEQYMQFLKDGNYEEAADCMSNYYMDYQELIKQQYNVIKELQESEGEEDISQDEMFGDYIQCYYYELNLSQEEYVEYRKESFVEMMENYSSEAAITEFTLQSAQSSHEVWFNGVYDSTGVTFSIKEEFQGDERKYLGEVTIIVKEDSVRIKTAYNRNAEVAGYGEESLCDYIHSTIRGMYGRYFGIGLWREETER